MRLSTRRKIKQAAYWAAFCVLAVAFVLLASLIGAAALHALPTRYRDWALNAGLVIEAGCVANNLRLGIGIKF